MAAVGIAAYISADHRFTKRSEKGTTLSFDREKQRRVGRVQVTSNLGEQPVFYVIEWQDRGKRLFQLRVSDQPP